MSDLSETNEPEAQAKPSVQEQNTVLSDMQMKLKERYLIDFGEPIETLDMNGAKAYKASDVIDKDKLLFALVCSRETAPRLSILPYLKALNSPHLLKLVEYGVLVPPKTKEAEMILIYQRPLGGKVIDDMSMPFKENVERLQSLCGDILETLQNLRTYSLTHRSIRLNNLFYSDETKKTNCSR